jgi:hypothetical protein
MTFDISQYELKDTAVLTVKNVQGSGPLIGEDGVNPVTITIYSSGSAYAVAARHAFAKKQQERMQAAYQGNAASTAVEDTERDKVELLSARTQSIGNFPLEPSALYANQKLGYITRQVDEFAGKDANFAPPSLTD